MKLSFALVAFVLMISIASAITCTEETMYGKITSSPCLSLSANNNHQQYMNVTSYFTTTVNITFDFENAVNWHSVERKESGVWVDRTANMQTLVRDGRYYYTFMNVVVTKDQVMEVRWNFKPESVNQAGKYNVLFWKGAYTNPTIYVNLDPYWGVYDIDDFTLEQSKTEGQQTNGIFITNNGTEMYILNYTGTDFAQYRLSQAWNQSTGTKLHEISSARDSAMYGLYISSDGTKAYTTGQQYDLVYQWTMSTPWNISTITYTKNISSIGLNPTGISFKNDGTKMYVSSGTTVEQFDLGTAWDIATATNVYNVSTAAQSASPIGIMVSSDGTRAFVVGTPTDVIFQYNLGTAWNISTATYSTKSLNIDGDLVVTKSIFVNELGTRAYVSSATLILQYNIDEASAITIEYPEAGVPITTSTFNLNFTVPIPNLNYSIYQDGVLNKTVNVTDAGGKYGEVWNSAPAGNHNFTVVMTAIPEVNTTRNYTRGNYSVQINYPTDSLVLIGMTVPLNFTLLGTNASAQHNVSFIKNGSAYASYLANESVPYLVNITETTGGSKTYIITDYLNALINDSVTFTVRSAELNNVTIKPTALETEQFYFYMYFTNYTNGVTITPNINMNGTSYTPTLYYSSGNNQTYRALVTIPEITGSSENITINASATFYLIGVENSSASISQTVNVSTLAIGACSGSTTTLALNITAWNEENTTLQLTNATYETRISYYINDDYKLNFSLTSYYVNNQSICIYPADQTFYVDITTIVTKTNYTPREYNTLNSTLDNSTDHIKIYLLNSSNTLSYPISLYVIDASSIYQSGVIVKVQRYTTNTTSWVDMTTLITDSSGKASVYLVPNDVYYRFIVLNTAQEVLLTSEPTKITAASVTLEIGSGLVSTYVLSNGIAYDCTYNNATTTLRCEVIDTSQYSSDFRLEVNERLMFGATNLCNETQSGSTVTLTCVLSNTTAVTQGFIYNLYVTMDDDEILLYTDEEVVGNTISYGELGIFLTALIIISMAFVGLWNPSVAVILAYIGVLVSHLLGFIYLETLTLTGLGALACIIAYFTRS